MSDGLGSILVRTDFGLTMVAFAGFALLTATTDANIICTRLEPQHVACTVERPWFGLVLRGEPREIERVGCATEHKWCDVGGCTLSLRLLDNNRSAEGINAFVNYGIAILPSVFIGVPCSLRHTSF